MPLPRSSEASDGQLSGGKALPVISWDVRGRASYAERFLRERFAKLGAEIR